MTAEDDRSPAGMASVSISYEDEFAPSSATLSTNDLRHVQSKWGRFLFYNQHLTDEGERIGLLEEIMGEAEELGCLRFPVPNPLGWIRVSDYYIDLVYQRLKPLVEQYPEGAEEWLVLQCYFHVVQATESVLKGYPSGFMGEHMLFVGAAVRELELVRRNKRDALARRKQKRGLSQNNEGRDQYNRERQEAAGEWKELAAGIAKESSTTGMKRARWVAKQLEKRHGIVRSEKTVANFLK